MDGETAKKMALAFTFGAVLACVLAYTGGIDRYGGCADPSGGIDSARDEVANARGEIENVGRHIDSASDGLDAATDSARRIEDRNASGAGIIAECRDLARECAEGTRRMREILEKIEE